MPAMSLVPALDPYEDRQLGFRLRPEPATAQHAHEPVEPRGELDLQATATHALDVRVSSLIKALTNF